MSNYFPAVSTDGKWLVFCKADNYMLLMPDSRLYIVPLKGGKTRKLECNLPPDEFLVCLVAKQQMHRICLKGLMHLYRYVYYTYL